MSHPDEPRDGRESADTGGTAPFTPRPPAGFPEPDADQTERFSRDGEHASIGTGEDRQAPDTRNSDVEDLASTQPHPRGDSDEFDEDLIRTRERPSRTECLPCDRDRMLPQRGFEASGVFPHPAATAFAVTGTVRRVSVGGLPADSQTKEGDDESVMDARIARAYRDYVRLCQEHRQTVVGEAEFRQVLLCRLERLSPQHPRSAVAFRAVFEDGQVRVRVVLAKPRS